MAFLSPSFVIGTLRIGSIEGASCINMGNNVPTGFESHKKHNQGFGSITGDHNDIEGIQSKLTDSNLIDMMNQADMDDIPEWVKGLIIEKMAEDKYETVEEFENDDISD